LADHAAHSIDLQYYIFQNDATGRLLTQRLLAAADRGVRVRMLIDDINLKDVGQVLDALDAHENIEVRVFNPFSTREASTLSKVGQFLIDGQRLNRRMHNKSFIADNTAAIIGGRNIGDDYFDAGNETNFRDLDVGRDRSGRARGIAYLRCVLELRCRLSGHRVRERSRYRGRPGGAAGLPGP
jgi:putative cardiolipin synthase